MAKKVIGNNFNSGLVGNQITGIKGTNTFSIGNAFVIHTNDEEREFRNYKGLISNFSKPITLSEITNDVETFNKVLNDKAVIKFNFDRSNIKNYALFGSLSEYFRVTINSIISKFPAALYIDTIVDQLYKINILDYVYDTVTNTTTFKIPKICIVNNFEINYTVSDTSKNYTRDLIKSFNKYTILDSDDNKEYPLIGYSGDTVSQYINIKTSGNPFPLATGGTLSKKYHIKPNYHEIESFFSGLSDLEAYLLNREGNPKYSAAFTSVKLSNEGIYYMVPQNFIWETSDGYNIDYNNSKFDAYQESLNELGSEYDDYKTNLISRFLTSSSVKEFDTSEQKLDKLLKIYGREFDEINKYINSLANVYSVSYDKKDNAPDLLIKNLAKTLGWEVFDIVQEEDLFKRYLGEDDKLVFSGNSKNLTPAEVDIELWRRILLNTSYLFRSKGTRKSIEFIFRLIGAPDNIVDFNEHVYLMNDKVNINKLTREVKLTLPIDDEGYPKLPISNGDRYFQMKGGWESETLINQSHSSVGVHIGPYDRGESYYDSFKELTSIKLDKIVDNKKSWSEDTQKVDFNKFTNYTSDSRLIINSKEVEIYIDSAKGIEYDIFKRNFDTNQPINITLNTAPIPNTVLTNIDIDGLTFYEYLNFIYENLINVKNRKVITDNFGSGYSTLRLVYEEYSKLPNALNFGKLSPFLDRINGIWLKIVEQFIPSTAIWSGGNKFRNTIFDRQKFNYKQGINDGSEFEKEQVGSSVVNIVSSPEIYSKINTGIKGNVRDITNFSVIITTGMYTQPVPAPNTTPPVDDTTSTIITLEPPKFIVSGCSKIMSGLISPVIWETKDGNKPLVFRFTGDTSGLNSGANPLYEFAYKIYPRSGVIFSKIPIQANNFDTTIFSLQIGSGDKTISDTFNSLSENEYLIKGYYNFTSDTLNRKLIGNTDNLIGSSYDIYDPTMDWYFVQIETPQSPDMNIQSMFNIDPNAKLDGVKLVNKRLLVDYENQSQFVLDANPIGDFLVSINGVSIVQTKFADYRDKGEFFVDRVSYADGVILKLANQVSITRDDIIVVTYVANNNLNNSNSGISSSFYVVNTPIISGVGSRGIGLIYSTVTNRYEYWFNEAVNPDTTNSGDIIVILNGLVLALGTDWGYSSSSPYKIGFTELINNNDTLFFIMSNNATNYLLSDNKIIPAWEDKEYSSIGNYKTEITTANDIGFNNVLYTTNTSYNVGTTNANVSYTSPTIMLSGGSQTFLLRVESRKIYTTLFGQDIETLTYSSTIKFTKDNTGNF